MSPGERDQLVHAVEALDREHPDWTARDIEKALLERHGVAYGNWSEETPELASRLRAIQRWRGASEKALVARRAALQFPYVWPLGERQRAEIQPTFTPAHRVASGSWRLFLYNCGPETVREVHVRLDGHRIGYIPFLESGKFAEISWQRIDAVKASSLGGESPSESDHELQVDFLIARGTRAARLVGTLRLNPEQGWTNFDVGEGRQREIE